MAALHASFTGPRYYDEYLAPVSFGPFAEELVRRVPAQATGRVLEIACGTGAVTRPLRERLPPEVELVATDLSPAMLEYARERLSSRASMRFEMADAMALPFADGSFSAVVCGFGLMFPPDRRKAVAETRRVLAEGGCLCFSVWDGLENNTHALANAQAIEALAPDDPELRFRVPYDMNDPAMLEDMLIQAGFGDVRIERVRLAMTDADPRKIAMGQVLGTPRSALLTQRGFALEDVVERVAAQLVRSGGDPYRGHAQALLVTASAA